MFFFFALTAIYACTSAFPLEIWDFEIRRKLRHRGHRQFLGQSGRFMLLETRSDAFGIRQLTSKQHHRLSTEEKPTHFTFAINFGFDMSPNSTLLEPQLAVLAGKKDDPIECSVHTLPKPLIREFRHVFGEKYLQDMDSMQEDGLEILAIPTNQEARQDLVAVGDDVELEKDRLLNVFLEFGKELCDKIRAEGYWADYIDPCSGLPMMTKECNKVYSEVDGMECLLNYRAHNAGFCKVLTHPKWGSAVYPATIFCFGPRDQVIQLVKEYQFDS